MQHCYLKLHISPLTHCVALYFPLVDQCILIICGFGHIYLSLSLYIFNSYTRHYFSIKFCSVFQFVHLDFTLTWLFPLGEVMFHVSMPPPSWGLRETQGIHRHSLHTLIKPSHRKKTSHWVILWEKCENLQHFYWKEGILTLPASSKWPFDSPNGGHLTPEKVP